MKLIISFGLILFCLAARADTSSFDVYDPATAIIKVYEPSGKALGRYVGTVTASNLGNYSGYLMFIDDKTMAWVSISGDMSYGLVAFGNGFVGVPCCYSTFNCSGQCLVSSDLKLMKNMLFKKQDNTFAKVTGLEKPVASQVLSCSSAKNRCESTQENSPRFIYRLSDQALPEGFPSYPFKEGLLYLEP